MPRLPVTSSWAINPCQHQRRYTRCRRKFEEQSGFAASLKTIEQVIEKHPPIKRGPKKESEKRFRAVFGNSVEGFVVHVT